MAPGYSSLTVNNVVCLFVYFIEVYLKKETQTVGQLKLKFVCEAKKSNDPLHVFLLERRSENHQKHHKMLLEMNQAFEREKM